MHYAFVRAEPAKLAVPQEFAIECSRIFAEPVYITPREPVGQRLDRCDLQVVAATDTESKPVTGQIGIGCVQAADMRRSSRDLGSWRPTRRAVYWSDSGDRLLMHQ